MGEELSQIQEDPNVDCVRHVLLLSGVRAQASKAARTAAEGISPQHSAALELDF